MKINRSSLLCVLLCLCMLMSVLLVSCNGGEGDANLPDEKTGEEKIEVYRALEDISSGSKIVETKVEKVLVYKSALPEGTLTSADAVVGKFATDKIFAGANYIVTPTDKNTPQAINTCLELGRLLGFSNVTTLSPEEHDEMIGFLSQLTHCIAITLMTCNDKENMEKFTGDSFRDLTRIARINDLMWSELFVANKDALLEQMDMFMDKFKELKMMLKKKI